MTETLPDSDAVCSYVQVRFPVATWTSTSQLW